MYIHFEALLCVKTTPDTSVNKNERQAVSYAQFWSDVERVARYWRRTSNGFVKDREVVGV
jgi:hypothetical protein